MYIVASVCYVIYEEWAGVICFDASKKNKK